MLAVYYFWKGWLKLGCAQLSAAFLMQRNREKSCKCQLRQLGNRIFVQHCCSSITSALWLDSILTWWLNCGWFHLSMLEGLSQYYTCICIHLYEHQFWFCIVTSLFDLGCCRLQRKYLDVSYVEQLESPWTVIKALEEYFQLSYDKKNLIKIWTVLIK